jgi:glutamate racemase
MSLTTTQPVGIFDSGAGGLTVAAAVRNLLPEEQIIYFGDTAHLPYGDKSAETVRRYSLRIADFLLSKNCKVILIACNTASAAAFDAVVEHVNGKVPVINVIDPATEYVAANPKLKHVGVIGTKGTIGSGMYPQKINDLSPDKHVVSLATPLLVPMIEEGFIFDDISNAVVKKYLESHELKGIDSLILGCTHYPIIKNQIRKFYDFETVVIDSSQVVAQKLKETLANHNLLSTKRSGEHQFFVSDYSTYFKKLAEMFFEEEIDLQKVTLE